MGVGQDFDYLYIKDVVRDFGELKEFSRNCGMPDQLAITEPTAVILSKLRALRLSAKLNLMKEGEIARKWGAKGWSLTVPSHKLNGKWHVAVELMGPHERLVVGWLLSGYGHYVEQVAAGNAERGRIYKTDKLGKYAMRGTSFDEAVRLVARTCGFPEDDIGVLGAADELVGNLNGVWLSMASGIDTQHMCADLMMGCVELGNEHGFELSRTVTKYSKKLSRAMKERNFYAQHIESIGWESEKEMCLVMDAATVRLLKTMS